MAHFVLELISSATVLLSWVECVSCSSGGCAWGAGTNANQGAGLGDDVNSRFASPDDRCVQQAEECVLGPPAASVEGFSLPQRPGPPVGNWQERLRSVCSVTPGGVPPFITTLAVFSLLTLTLEDLIYVFFLKLFAIRGSCRLLACELRLVGKSG